LQRNQRQRIFVARDQDTIFGWYKVGFYEVSALFHGQLIGCQGVLWSFAAGASMSNHQRTSRLCQCTP
jgi:hypothetical protein